jgi:hypothetical protein
LEEQKMKKNKIKNMEEEEEEGGKRRSNNNSDVSIHLSCKPTRYCHLARSWMFVLHAALIDLHASEFVLNSYTFSIFP